MFNKLFLNILKKYKFRLLILFILISFFEFVTDIFIMPYLIKMIGDKYTTESLNLLSLIIIIFMYSILFCSRHLYILLSWKWLNYGALAKIRKDLQVELFSYVEKHSVNYFNTTMAGTLVNKIRNISEQAYDAIPEFFKIIGGTIMFIALIIIYYKINIYMFYFLIIWTAIYFISSYYLSKLTYNAVKKATEKNNEISGFMTDNFINIMNVKSFSHEKKELGNLKKHNILFLREESKVMWVGTLSNIFMFILKVALLVFILGFSFALLMKKEITIGMFLFIGQNIVMVSFLVNNMFTAITNIVQRISEMNEGFSTLLKPIEINDGNKKLQVKNGRIAFRDLNFFYEKG